MEKRKQQQASEEEMTMLYEAIRESKAHNSQYPGTASLLLKKLETGEFFNGKDPAV